MADGSLIQRKIGFSKAEIDAIQTWQRRHRHGSFSAAVRTLAMTKLDAPENDMAERIGRAGQILNILVERVDVRKTAINRAQVEELCRQFSDALCGLRGQG